MTFSYRTDADTAAKLLPAALEIEATPQGAGHAPQLRVGPFTVDVELRVVTPFEALPALEAHNTAEFN